MNSFVIALFAALAIVDASNLIASPSSHILQGPSSKTTVIGPEGSAISAVAPGGRIIHEEQPGSVAYGHGAHYGGAAYSASHNLFAPHGGYAGYSGLASGYSSPVVAHHGSPLAYSGLSAGHFGGAASFGRYAAASHPAVSSYSSQIVHSSPVSAHAAPIVSAHSSPFAYSARSAPVVSSHSSQIVHAAPYAAGGHLGYAAHSPVVSAHSLPHVTSYSAPSAVVAAHHHGLAPSTGTESIVAGPSGTIVSGKSFGHTGYSGLASQYSVLGHGYSGLANQGVSVW